MTLHTFIKTIKAAGNISGSLENIAIDLYHYSKIFYAPASIEAALKEKRPPLPKNQDSINEYGFLQYFEERTISTWPEMQAAFGELDECVLIDQDTKDRNIFYESLLAQFYDILRLVPVSFLEILPRMPLVFGRETELRQLEDIFETCNYAVLTGIGGVGKSCVALAYAHNLKISGQWMVQHIICENKDTLQAAILKLRFNGLTDIPKEKKNAYKENLSRRVDCLKNSSRRMLIVLENLNRPFTAEDYDTFKRITESGNHVRILITSCTELINDKQYVVPLLPLDDNTLLEFYSYHRFEDSADHSDYIAQHKDILMRLFSIAEKHTLAIKLLASLPNRTFMNEYEVYNRLASGWGIHLRVAFNKDGSISTTFSKELLKQLFDISNLTDSEKAVMRHMSIIPASGINVKLFEELTHHTRQDIRRLNRSNWIILDDEALAIRLHPIVCEAILSFDDIRPTEENCAELVNLIEKKRDMFEEGTPQWHEFNKILACYAENVFFHEVTTAGLNDCFESEYREGLLILNKAVMNYLNADSFDGWSRMSILSDGDDDNDDNDDGDDDDSSITDSSDDHVS